MKTAPVGAFSSSGVDPAPLMIEHREDDMEHESPPNVRIGRYIAREVTKTHEDVGMSSSRHDIVGSAGTKSEDLDASFRGGDAKKFTRLQIAYNEVLQENEKLRDAEDTRIEKIRLLKAQLDLEKKTSRELKSEKTNFYQRRN